jgi:hypothetical protein
MQEYKLYFLDRKNVVILAQDFVGRDDLDALDEAERLSKTHTIEVWSGSRKVALVKKGNIPPSDQSSDQLGG